MSAWSTTAFVALGANLGSARYRDPAASVGAAMAELCGHFAAGEVVCSSLWRTAPVDCPEGSPDFVNGVVGLPIAAYASPVHLLAELQEMEERFGRARGQEVNAPRTLDLDIITYGLQQVAERDLVIPHPRARERRFVLQPLAEIAPELQLPGEVRTVSELLSRAQPLAMERIDRGK